MSTKSRKSANPPAFDAAAIRRGLEADTDVLARQLKKRDAAALARVRSALGMPGSTDEAVAAVGRSRLLNVIAHTIGYATWNAAVAGDFQPMVHTGEALAGEDLDEGALPLLAFAASDAPAAARAIAQYIADCGGEPVEVECEFCDDEGRVGGLTCTRCGGDGVRRVQPRGDSVDVEALAARVVGALDLSTGAFDYDHPTGVRYIAWPSVKALRAYLIEWLEDAVDEDMFNWNDIRRQVPQIRLRDFPDNIPFSALIDLKGYTMPRGMSAGGRPIWVVEQR